jgi:ring-1,2-phenylacetyl-CoA epoxidase subunit PaaE
MSHFHSLEVLRIERLTNEAVAISFKLPLIKKTRFRFRAGQYLTIKAKLESREIRRSYSICSYPGFDDHLKIAVKKVPGGVMSTYLCDTLREGDILEVMEPQGHFTFDTNPDLARKMLFFAAGSGITPILSHIKAVLIGEPRAEIMLFYANKERGDVLFDEELRRLAVKYRGRLHLRYFFSRSEGVPGVNEYHGRMEAEQIDTCIREQIGHPGLGQYFLCGPEAFMDMILEFTDSYYIPRFHVRAEHFVAADLKGPIEGEAVDCSLTVRLEGSTYHLVIPKGRYVLDVLLENNIDAPYSCQGGVCASCMARVKSGSFNTDQNISLSPDDHDEGLFLSCASFPLSAEAEIDFDEV